MTKSKKNYWLLGLGVLAIVIVAFIIWRHHANTVNENSFINVGSAKKLTELYEEEYHSYDYNLNLTTRLLTLPYSLFSTYYYPVMSARSFSDDAFILNDMAVKETSSIGSLVSNATTTVNTSGSNNDYSTTNIQVENVDEADITKTDGNYIYSLSGDRVIISDVRDSANLKIAAEITMSNSGIPEDILLYQNQLIIIGSDMNSDAVVNIFNIEQRENPILIKKYALEEDYYTSRLTDGKLYVFANGWLQENDDEEIEVFFKDDNLKTAISYDNIKYLPAIPSSNLTTVAITDLNNTQAATSVDAYLMNLSNAYISEKNVYLFNEKYNCDDNDDEKKQMLQNLFSWKGIFGLFDDSLSHDCADMTNIYKFNIENGNFTYVGNAEVSGATINQFSIDEYQNNLRVALKEDGWNAGAKVVVFDEKMNQIGSLTDIAVGETMYSSRFIGDKAYLVTYKNTDPLFVISLADPSNPEILGELKIPGYSTYLHPYDEDHLIGIGMETEEKIIRDSQGRVVSQRASVVGMKMALFDVSNVNAPKQISNVVIGDAHTSSAVLTNHKALLFSKEKNLLAIPVNRYSGNFVIEDLDEDDLANTNRVINYYSNYDEGLIGEGYLVYDLTLTDGFQTKGMILHDFTTENLYGRYRPFSNMLRGLYINDDLYTVSESAVKINRLSDLAFVNELNLVGTDLLVADIDDTQSDVDDENE